MKAFAFHREADAEFIAALGYYVKISPELGSRYYDAIHQLISEACEKPKTFRVIRSPVRRHFTRKFPFAIIYVERPDDIWILAVMHLQREPGYWINRTGQ